MMNSTRRHNSAWRASVVDIDAILFFSFLSFTALTGCAHRPADGLVSPQSARAFDATAAWRTQARAVLEEGAASPDPAVRRRALLALLTTDPEPEAWRLRCRWDPSPMVQRGLIGVLTDRQDAGTRDLLQQLSTGAADPMTRGLAALTLGSVSTEEAAQWLEDAMKQPTWDRPLLLLAALQRGAPETRTAATVALQDWLRQGEYPLDAELFLTPARYGVPELAAPLAEGISHAELEVRMLAAATLLALDPVTAQPILSSLLRDADADQVLDLIDALALLHPPHAANRSANDSSDDRAVRNWLRQAGTTDPWARDLSRTALVARQELPPSTLRSLLKSDDREMQRAAAESIRTALQRDPSLRAPTLIGPLRELLQNDRSTTRLAATEALGLLGDTAPLTELLDDTFVHVRIAAAAAIY
jgi:HEAT repeat protein